MINFYRRHIRDLAAVAWPLTILTRKDKTTGQEVQFKWTTECERVFCSMKEKLLTAPVLRPHCKNKSVVDQIWVSKFCAHMTLMGCHGHCHP